MKRQNKLDEAIFSTANSLTERSSKEAREFDRAGLKKQVEELLLLLRSAMYPQIFGDCRGSRYICEDIQLMLRQSALLLLEIINDIMTPEEMVKNDPEDIVCEFLGSLEGICELIGTDVKAAYEGDPAARSETEIMLAYPAFEAISIYRIAHRLHELKVPLIPRMMTEYAHQLTGIDIHPGATIGEYFFIDHGTGVVIGETCTIKDHVKLYQGVTLGALSFKLGDDGNPVKGIKRHPDIGSHVIIYAGATILGGSTYVGDGSVIGGNVWLTHSVPAGSKIYYNEKN